MYRGEVHAWLSACDGDLEALNRARRAGPLWLRPYPLDRLLPAIFHRHAAVLEPAEKRHLRDSFCRAWQANLQRVAAAQELVKALLKAGVESLLLKGLSLLGVHYPQVGQRPMGDFDLLIRPSELTRADRVLRSLGWLPDVPLPSRAWAVHAVNYTRADQCVDLHWFSLGSCRWPGADDFFWRDSRAFELGDAPCRVLSPTHQFLHLCLHGASFPVNPIWVLDARRLLRQPLDWPEVAREVERRRLGPLLDRALAYLGLEPLQGVATPVPDRLYLWLNGRRRGWLHLALEPCLDFHRCEGKPVEFLDFLCSRWGLRNWRQLPGEVWFRLISNWRTNFAATREHEFIRRRWRS